MQRNTVLYVKQINYELWTDVSNVFIIVRDCVCSSDSDVYDEYNFIIRTNSSLNSPPIMQPKAHFYSMWKPGAKLRNFPISLHFF